MFSGSFADSSGRRPAYLVLFVIYVAACIGLALQSDYVALLLLRCIQSSGCSGMVAIASGVVSDLAERKERGGYMGIVSGGALLGPAVGPIIGGLIGQKAGWRWIFWFLTILGGICAIFLAVFVPETSRKIVGNGSTPPPLLNKSLLQVIRSRRSRIPKSIQNSNEVEEAETKSITEVRIARKSKFQWTDILFTLKMLLEKDIVILLFSYSIIYSAYYCVLSSLPGLFEEIYGYGTLQTGLCFIPIGVGMWVSSLVSGRILDYNYESVAKNLPPDTKADDFPIEKARLRSIWVGVGITVAAVISYGWVLHQEVVS
jgi:multidrug resistance protein